MRAARRPAEEPAHRHRQLWHHLRVTRLHVHRYGPSGPVRVLAIHGLTGHGKRWQPLATQHLPEIAVAAPDLIGHGRSSWAAPWTIDANVAALSALLEQQADAPVVVVAHSFGGAVALHLAAAHPDLVAALVLLDPAIGLDGAWMREIADAMLASPDYPDAAEARAEKATGSWADVDPAVLDAELERTPRRAAGRAVRLAGQPARDDVVLERAGPRIVLPPNGISTTLVRAAWTSPPYVTDELIAGLRSGWAPSSSWWTSTATTWWQQARPAEVAASIRERMR